MNTDDNRLSGMKDYLFDGHKLIYHIDRVNDFLEKGDCFPLYMEISVGGSCNHRCIFCAYDYIGYPNRKLKTSRLLKFIDEVVECGIRSLLFAGEGEPLLHPDIDKFIIHSKNKGIDIGIYTNGQFLTEELAERLLPFLTFIRFSFNGGTKENYANIHRVKSEIFDKVLKNIETAVTIKRRKKLSLDIGLQYVLLPENIDYLIAAIKTFKDIGINYFVIKPFVQQNDSQFYQMKERFGLKNIKAVLDKAERLTDENFKVIARRTSFENYGKRNYKNCYGISFISVLNSAGDVATCLPYWDKEDFVFGNIYDNTFKEIWLSKRRKKIKALIERSFNVQKCPPNCRLNAINEFLFEIKNPTIKHLNFV